MEKFERPRKGDYVGNIGKFCFIDYEIVYSILGYRMSHVVILYIACYDILHFFIRNVLLIYIFYCL
jgi:hypothetical protein